MRLSVYNHKISCISLAWKGLILRKSLSLNSPFSQVSLHSIPFRIPGPYPLTQRFLQLFLGLSSLDSLHTSSHICILRKSHYKYNIMPSIPL